MSPRRVDEMAFGRAMAQALLDAVVCVDRDAVITLWSAASERIYGWSEAEAVGRKIDLITPPAHLVDDADARRRALSGETMHGLETVRRRRDGTLVGVALTFAPMLDEHGQTSGVVMLTKELSSRERSDPASRRLAAIVESSDDAIISKDLNGIVTSWNVAAERMFGYSAAEMVGTSIRLLIPFERQGEEDATLARIRRGERLDHFETMRRRKDGSLLPISLTVSPIRDDEGRVVGASKIARDITALKQAESERARLLQESAAANRLKDEFLASLSHELRTPLNAILGYARMVRAGIIPPAKQPHAIETIERNATSLTQIVEDVLDVSRIISGKMRLAVQPVELSEIVPSAIEAVAPAADAKSIRIDVDLGPSHALVSGDPERLQQVLWNLLSNAVKFTARGGRVGVTLRHVDDSVELTVDDTGIGMSAEFLPHVFERFRQADAGITREHGGLGLGLAITRQLVELHGGTIHASSDGPGRGSTFRITLPVMNARRSADSEPVGSSRRPVARGSVAASELRGLRVLAVDDDADARRLVHDILDASGVRVEMASSAAEALAILDTTPVDVLVADLGMPLMHGFDFIALVRQHPDKRVREVPAVALTAYARSEDRVRALRAGFHVHLAKPIEPAALMATIAALGGRRAGC